MCLCDDDRLFCIGERRYVYSLRSVALAHVALCDRSNQKRTVPLFLVPPPYRSLTFTVVCGLLMPTY